MQCYTTEDWDAAIIKNTVNDNECDSIALNKTIPLPMVSMM